MHDSVRHAEAIILVGHGTRDARGTAEFHKIAALVADRTGSAAVFPCFLELAEPTIHQAVARAIASGASRLVVVPVLLFAAGHAKRDIPAAVAAALEGASQRATWRQSDVLESRSAIAEMSAARFAKALVGRTEVSPDQTCVVLVGRGSRDPEATAAMQRFARVRAEEHVAGRVATGFIAMAEPRYGDVLRRFAGGPFTRVVVQPHLLFHGKLLDEVREQVEQIRQEFPATEWIVTEHLGPDERLAEAIIELYRTVQ